MHRDPRDLTCSMETPSITASPTKGAGATPGRNQLDILRAVRSGAADICGGVMGHVPLIVYSTSCTLHGAIEDACLPACLPGAFPSRISVVVNHDGIKAQLTTLRVCLERSRCKLTRIGRLCIHRIYCYRHKHGMWPPPPCVRCTPGQSPVIHRALRHRISSPIHAPETVEASLTHRVDPVPS